MQRESEGVGCGETIMMSENGIKLESALLILAPYVLNSVPLPVVTRYVLPYDKYFM